MSVACSREIIKHENDLYTNMKYETLPMDSSLQCGTSIFLFEGPCKLLNKAIFSLLNRNYSVGVKVECILLSKLSVQHLTTA
jgi:hypothetical protein